MDKTTEKTTFVKTIWVSRKDDFIKKVKHLNGILARHGKDPITYSFENYRIVKKTFTCHTKGESYATDTTETRNVEVCDAVCHGLLLVKKDDADYAYLGTVSIADGIRQVFCNNEAYARYFMDDFREGYCDHCHSTRSNRKIYYLFLNPADNSVLQIGSTCAKEYFGINSDAFLKTYGSTFIVTYEGSDDSISYSGGTQAFDFAEVAHALDICTNGFLKWNKRGNFFPELPLWENPTVDGVEMLLGGTDPLPPRDNFRLMPYEECLAFWEETYNKEDSTFAYNCLNALRAGYATIRTMGVFAYAIFKAYNAKIEKMRAEEAAKREYTPCAYAVNSRQNIKGTITNIREFQDEGFQGIFYNTPEITKYIVDFTEDNGTLYHFTTSGATFSKLDKGDRVEIRCTIGETKPYKGVPYTRVSRPTAKKLAA